MARISKARLLESRAWRGLTAEEFHGRNANTRKNALKFCHEQWVTVMDQIALAIQNSVHCIRHISADLTHPQSVCIGCYASDFHPTSRQIDKEQDQEALQASSGPDLYGEEVCGYDQLPVARQKLLPSRLSAPLCCRFDLVPMENISDCAPGQLVSEIGYGTLDAAITPGTVFRRQATKVSISFLVRGRPGPRFSCPSYFCAISFRCHANKVSGVTKVAISARNLRPSPLARALSDAAGHH